MKIKILILISVMFVIWLMTGCASPNEPNNDDKDTRYWKLLGLEGEKINFIRTHPDSASVIYVGSTSVFYEGKTGSVFRSIDGGANWDTLLRNVSVSDIEFFPDDGSSLVVTSVRNGLHPPGIFKTTDCGATWDTLADPAYVDWESPQSISINQEDSDEMVLGVGGFGFGGIFKTSDGGRSWRKVDTFNLSIDKVFTIARDPGNPLILYAGTDWIGALLKSVDGGESWNDISCGDLEVIEDLKIDPLDFHTIWAASYSHGVWRSKDSGGNWTSINSGLSDSAVVNSIAFNSTGDVYISAINSYLVSKVYIFNKLSNVWEQVGEYAGSGASVIDIGVDGSIYVGSGWIEKY